MNTTSVEMVGIVSAKIAMGLVSAMQQSENMAKSPTPVLLLSWFPHFCQWDGRVNLYASEYGR
eukprot:11180983-Lingulodinium_polyedra.AAC.1